MGDHIKQRNSLKTVVALLLAFSLVVELRQGFGLAPVATPTAHASSYDTLPLAFEPNRGQAGDGVQFVVHHGQSVTAFTSDGAITSIGAGAVTMSLLGANAQSYVGHDELESKTNYFIGNDPSKWQSDIPNYQSLLAEDVYPGIDLTYYGTNSQLEHDFIVAPGADYTQIAFTFAGQDNFSLDENGNLVLKLGDDTLTFQAPKTYQERPGTIHTIPSSFVLEGDTVRFELHGEYDKTLPLVIDPVLIYSTYLGGSGDEQALAIAIDASGNAYLAGQTSSTDFPTASPYQAANNGSYDAFVAKLNPSGTGLVFSTYLGGSGVTTEERVQGVAVALDGTVYLSGNTDSADFPTASPFQSIFAGGVVDGFVTKLSADGSSLVYSTYLGGSAHDYGRGITVDAAGYAYLVGFTGSANFPTQNPIQATINGAPHDAFVAKLDPTGSSLVYSTYLGGSASDLPIAPGIGLDTDGNVYIVGATFSTDFPTVFPYQASNGGGADLFISKIDAAGSSLVYSTYLGGSGDEGSGGGDMAIDPSGAVYVTANTTSSDYPVVSAYQPTSAGGAADAVLSKLDTTGSALVYSTYLGGSDTEVGNGLAVNSAGEAYIAGTTASTDFPLSNAYQDSNAGGSSDAFVTKFSSAGTSLGYSTYLGGAGTDLGLVVTLGLSGNAYVSGITTSVDFPTLSPYQATNAGGANDAFLTQLSEHTVLIEGVRQPVLTFTLGSTTCDFGVFSATQTKFCTHTLSAGTNAVNGYVMSYLPTATLTSGGNTIDAMSVQGASVLASEQLGFNLRANTAVASFTATDFGADPVGGSGFVLGGYELADQFKFDLAGADIAQATGPTNITLYTASFIANIANVTEAGAYSTPITYNVVPNF